MYYGHRREVHPERSVYNRVFDLDSAWPGGASPYCGGDAVMRKAVLDQVGPYRDDLIAGEEPSYAPVSAPPGMPFGTQTSS